jgi:TonB family protein
VSAASYQSAHLIVFAALQPLSCGGLSSGESPYSFSRINNMRILLFISFLCFYSMAFAVDKPVRDITLEEYSTKKILMRIITSFAKFKPDGTNAMKSSIQITMSPKGDVMNAHIISSSGNQSFDSIAIQAVKSASPLPLPLPDMCSTDPLKIKIFTVELKSGLTRTNQPIVSGGYVGQPPPMCL